MNFEFSRLAKITAVAAALVFTTGASAQTPNSNSQPAVQSAQSANSSNTPSGATSGTAPSQGRTSTATSGTSGTQPAGSQSAMSGQSGTMAGQGSGAGQGQNSTASGTATASGTVATGSADRNAAPNSSGRATADATNNNPNYRTTQAPQRAGHGPWFWTWVVIGVILAIALLAGLARGPRAEEPGIEPRSNVVQNNVTPMRDVDNRDDRIRRVG